MIINKSINESKGHLEVVCGPMFSGKSEELIRRLRRATIAKQRVIVFKNRLDDRYTKQSVASHDGNTIDAHAVASVEEILQLGKAPEIDVIGIDEVQFFPQQVISVICELVESRKRVIAAGLDLDFRGMPFGCMPTLLAFADEIIKLQAICTICGAPAHFTQRLVNGKPANYDDPIIMIGAQEAYQARCRTCYLINKKPHTYEQKQNNL